MQNNIEYKTTLNAVSFDSKLTTGTIYLTNITSEGRVINKRITHHACHSLRL